MGQRRAASGTPREVFGVAMFDDDVARAFRVTYVIDEGEQNIPDHPDPQNAERPLIRQTAELDRSDVVLRGRARTRERAFTRSRRVTRARLRRQQGSLGGTP